VDLAISIARARCVRGRTGPPEGRGGGASPAGRPTSTEDENYLVRRLAVDFGVPLINDSKCALLFTEALPLRSQLKAGVKRWAEYVRPV
jgi:hypothetical protein